MGVYESNCGTMIFSHAVHAFVEPGVAKIRCYSPRQLPRARLQSCGAVSSNEGMRNTSPNPSHFTSNSGSSASRRLIAFGQTGPPVINTTCTSSRGDRGGNTGANRVTVFFNVAFATAMPGLLRRNHANNDRRCRLLRRVGWKR